MSFLRALRAYIGLGPDAEIEDRYLAELNARRRDLDLAELHPDDVGDDYGAFEDLDDFDADWDDDGEEEVVVTGRRSAGPAEVSRAAVPTREAGPVRSPRGSFEDIDDLDLALIERLERAGTRTGRHDIEPDSDLESLLVDDGVETVRLRARLDGEPVGQAEFDEIVLDDPGHQPEEGAVVRSLDARRAKPRTLMPESFADAKLVADEFKRDIPVVLNLQAAERDLARRLIDFASGICYVLDGSMEKIASQVFLLIPESAEVSEEDRRLIEERGYAR